MPFFVKKTKGLSSTTFSTKNGAGFTLVELLVVIAIIGLLVAINSIAINRYRDKASDAAIAVYLAQIRKAVAMIYTDENSYEFVCDAGTLNDAYPLLKAIEDNIKKLNGNRDVTCYCQEDVYCVQSLLASGYGAGYFCVDFTGFASNIDGDYCTTTSKDCSSP